MSGLILHTWRLPFWSSNCYLFLFMFFLVFFLVILSLALLSMSFLFVCWFFDNGLWISTLFYEAEKNTASVYRQCESRNLFLIWSSDIFFFLNGWISEVCWYLKECNKNHWNVLVCSFQNIGIFNMKNIYTSCVNVFWTYHDPKCVLFIRVNMNLHLH